MVEGRHHGPGHQAHVRRTLGSGAEEDDRVGTGAAVGLEVVLHDAHRRETKLVGALDQVQALREILRTRLLLGQEAWKEIHAEPHGGSFDAVDSSLHQCTTDGQWLTVQQTGYGGVGSPTCRAAPCDWSALRRRAAARKPSALR